MWLLKNSMEKVINILNDCKPYQNHLVEKDNKHPPQLQENNPSNKQRSVSSHLSNADPTAHHHLSIILTKMDSVFKKDPG